MQLVHSSPTVLTLACNCGAGREQRLKLDTSTHLSPGLPLPLAVRLAHEQHKSGYRNLDPIITLGVREVVVCSILQFFMP